ncbi:TonB-dependent receptor [Dyadobacter sp. CY261]|uniref:SusC/RagA family TonB-linked outer membrane protein n=1 Tax=Dyadobacter sp. CY261 TaxID=2907203 RepID=UPI001F3D4D75|nr:TonB-dependent receptor [Dyadobacter sp. CY261]MCF0069103.1 TonB-dependent receptor [Dyadobacter sp. CY261]
MKKNYKLTGKLRLCLLLAGLLLWQASAWAASVRGRVMSEKNDPLVGVNVIVKGTSTGTSTDGEGRFSLNVPDGGSTLIFSFIGYVSKEVPIGNESEINVQLVADTKILSEVVVVGYGTQRKSDITGSLSSISADQFKEQPVNRLDQVLQGRAAGVQVTNASGSPGGDVRIRIRGANSINGDNSPLYVVDGFVGADFNNINPDDIASLEVLKDASATAIYGSRGSNGVIIITTKTGKKGSMQVNFGARFSSSEILKRMDLLNAGDYAEMVNARAAATNSNPVFTQAQVDDYRRTGGTDWQDEILRKAGGQEYQLGVSGGNDKTTYLISANYLKQDGIINNSDFRRYSIRSNISSQVSDKFSVRLNFTGTRRENHNTSGTGARGSALGQAFAWAPTTPVYDATGNYTYRDPTGSIFENPLALTTDADYRTNRSIVNLIGGLRYEFIPGLALDVQYGVNYINQQDKSYAGPLISSYLPRAGRSSGEQVTLQNTNSLNYKKIFGKHSLDIIGVFETQKQIGESFYANATNLTYPAQSYNNLALAASNLIGSGYSKWSLMSYLGRINYAFNDRYLLSATIRRDGSSKFQGDNKWSVFPSVAAGWKVTEEAFMKSQNVFSNLKLRGSWGLTGNQAINPYGTLSSYITNVDDAGVAFTSGYFTNGITNGIVLGNPGNPDLKWETTEQVNVGMDAEILRGRVSLSVDYFVKNTRDLLLSQPLPAYIGGNNILKNIGEVQNRGWEFSVDADIIESKGFRWNSSINATFIKNKVVKLASASDTIFAATEFVMIPGQQMAAFWGLNYLGTWKANEADEAAIYKQKPGDAHYQDLNNDKVVDSKDYQVIGNGMPKTTLGWNNTFTYKGLSLNVFFQGVFGFDKLNYTYANGIVGSTDVRQPTFAAIKDRYIPGVNETSDIPAFSSAKENFYTQSTRFLERGDFLRMKNISLGYDIPKALVKNVAAIRVFVSGTNLLTFSKYKGIDPESTSNGVGDIVQNIDHASYPNSKTYTLGLNVTF